MIYDSLDIIPFKLFKKVAETGNFLLLSTDSNTDSEQLSAIWDRMHEEHLSKNQTTESKKIFKLNKNIDELIATQKTIVIACGCLEFDFDQDMYDIVTSYGFKISLESTEAYYSDLDKILRESNAFIIKAEYYKGMLPEEKKENEEFSVDDVMASYSAILGYSIGKHNEVTYTEYYSHEKSVNAKIDSIKSQIANSNAK